MFLICILEPLGSNLNRYDYTEGIALIGNSSEIHSEGPRLESRLWYSDQVGWSDKAFILEVMDSDIIDLLLKIIGEMPIGLRENRYFSMNCNKN